MASAGLIAPAAISYVAAPYSGHYAAAAPVYLRAAAPAEGDYIPDHTDKLYDDGSYKPELEVVPLAASPYGLTPAGSGLEGAYTPEVQAIPLAASPYGLTPAGSGLEGAYVHDISEKLYDDGSYKPELRAIPLANSPYGLTPAGSGLEGAYVQDISEKLYDDGSYKPELGHH